MDDLQQRIVEIIARCEEHRHNERLLNMRETDFWRREWRRLAENMADIIKELHRERLR